MEAELEAVDTGIGVVQVSEAPDEVYAQAFKDIAYTDPGFNIGGVAQGVDTLREAVNTRAIFRPQAAV